MHTYCPTQAVVLAGGQGSRLRPYTDDRPKPMVEIPGTGTPIIGHQLAWLASEGVTDAVISCGHLAEVLQKWLDTAELPLRVSTVVESEPLGRGGGLKYAAKQLPDADRPWYATNGDIWTHFSLREMAAFHAERDATATLALARPADSVGRCGDKRVRARPRLHRVAAVAVSHQRRGVRVLGGLRRACCPTAAIMSGRTFPRLARERKLAGFPLPHGAYWRAIDTVKDLAEAARELDGPSEVQEDR